MAGQMRLRCPVCGMVAWQSSLDREHEFEVLIQERIPGQGRGAKCWKWLRNFDPVGMGTRTLKLMLVKKLRQVAERLEREALSLTSTNEVKSASAMSVSASRLTPSATKFESKSTVMSAAQSFKRP